MAELAKTGAHVDSIVSAPSSAMTAAITRLVREQSLPSEVLQNLNELRESFATAGDLDRLSTERNECLKHVGADTLGEKILNFFHRKSARQVALMARAAEAQDKRETALERNHEIRNRVAEQIESLHRELFQPNHSLTDLLTVLDTVERMAWERKREWDSRDRQDTPTAMRLMCIGPTERGVVVPCLSVESPPDRTKYDSMRVIHAHMTNELARYIMNSLPSLRRIDFAMFTSRDQKISLPIPSACLALAEGALAVSDEVRKHNMEKARELTREFEKSAEIALREVKGLDKKIQREIATALIPEREASVLLPKLFA